MDNVSKSSAGTKSGGGATCAEVRVANAASRAEMREEVMATIISECSLGIENAE